MNYHEKIISSIPPFHWTNNPNTIKMKWQFFHYGNVFFSWKTSITPWWIKKHFFNMLLTLLYFSCMFSHNSHVFLYLNVLNPCIGNLDMFWNIWNLTLWRKVGKKPSICSDDYKFGSLIPGQPEQQSRIQSHFGIFDPIIGEG